MSGRHAVLRWTKRGAWTVRDLGSRNGTAVDGVRIEPGADVVLKTGSRLAFGDDSIAWRLVEDAPPPPCARNTATGEVRFFHDDLLALPHVAGPELAVYRHGRGWASSQDDRERTVQDGDVVIWRGVGWRLDLGPANETEEAGVSYRLAESRLELRVAPHWENVDLTVVSEHGAHPIAPSVHHHILAMLAKQKAEDALDERLSEAQRGWIDRTLLCEMLRTDRTKLNIDIFRLRKIFAKAGFHDSNDIIERRPTTGELRLGPARFAFLDVPGRAKPEGVG